MRSFLHLVVAISLFKSITFASTNNNDVIYVTSAFFQNLCPIVSIYEDIGLATAGLGNGTPYLQYQRYVQGDIIKALRRNGIKAFPDMTSSDFQIIQNFECFSEIEEFIKSERPIFHAKKTLVPVIDTSLIQLSSLNGKNEYKITINVNLFALREDAKLKKIGTIKLTNKASYDTTSNLLEHIKHFSEINKDLSKQLEESTTWKKMITDAVFREKKGELVLPFLGKSKVKENVYFFLSNAVIKEKYPIARLKKINFITKQERVSDLENEVDYFDMSKEIPAQFCGFIILPDKNIVYLSDNNLKIEQVGNTSNIFDYNAKVTINLTGLQPGSIVSYYILYVDSYLVTNQFKKGFKPVAIPLSQDFNIKPTINGDSWLFRVSIPFGDSLYHFISDSSAIDINQKMYASQKIITMTGDCADELNYDSRYLRLSTVHTYAQLYKSGLDSIYSKLSFPKVIKNIKKLSRNEIESEIYRTIHFLQDSVRYFHVSYGPKASIPEPEDSVMKNRQSDCKSNSVVIINRLHRLGISAVPALVHSYKKNVVNVKYPSYTATNHMIAYSPELDWWIDPTFGISPQWFIPSYLNGSAAILLYPDSVYVKNIPYNKDELFIDTFEYVFEINGKDTQCKVKEHMSCYNSFYFQEWFDKLSSENKEEKIVARTCFIDSNKISGCKFSLKSEGDKMKRVLLSREYKITGENKIIGGSVVCNWPETPIDVYDYLNDGEDTSMINTNGSGYETVVSITIKSDKKVSWTKPNDYNFDLFGLKILKWDSSNVLLRFFVKSGIIRGKDVTSYDKMMNEIGEFFNTEFILN